MQLFLQEMMLHLKNNTGFVHIFGSKTQSFTYLEVNLSLIWVSEGETWNLLYGNTGPDLTATQKQEGSMKKTNNTVRPLHKGHLGDRSGRCREVSVMLR